MTPAKRIQRIKRRLDLTAEKWPEFKPLAQAGVLTISQWMAQDDRTAAATRCYVTRVTRLESLWHAELLWLCEQATKVGSNRRDRLLAHVHGLGDALRRRNDTISHLKSEVARIGFSHGKLSEKLGRTCDTCRHRRIPDIDQPCSRCLGYQEWQEMNEQTQGI